VRAFGQLPLQCSELPHRGREPLGYLAAEEAKLNAIIRAKGGASLHSWSFDISVKCADKGQPLTPLTHDVPNDLAQNIFTNVSTVEIAEPAEPNFPGVRVQRCN
jgi:hypothetical protein